MATITQTGPSAASLARERRQRRRKWLIYGFTYVVLTVIALFMLFPFVYMITTSLKTASDVFRYPPQLLPFSQVTTEFNGEERPLYRVPFEGGTREMVLAEDSVRFGFFTTADLINTDDPRQSELIAQAPLDSATPTGDTAQVGGDTFAIYLVPDAQGEPQELLLAYRGALGLFVDPADPSISTYANVRTTPPVERIEFQWDNYRSVLTLNNLNRSLINTILVTFVVTAGQVVTSLLGGYAFSRMKFRGRDGVFLMYLGTIMIPFVVLIIPLYQLMVVFGWQDRLTALIFPWLFTAYGTFLMRQFFISIPKELEEAAFLDGLSRFGILWRVFVPLSGPAIATQAIITFLYAWNSFVWPLIIIGDSPIQNHVLTLSMITLRNNFASQPNMVLTGAAIAILPPLVLFFLAQRYFVEGVANTGMK
jgi:multiple sugar transport system permease protein